jgi:hypothetical protein
MSECQLYFKTEDLCLKVDWELMPTSSTFGSMLLTFTDKRDPAQPLSPKAHPFVKLWMTSMGHGSSPVTMSYVQEGIYRAENVFFIMPGPWDILYQLKEGEDVVEELAQSVEI